MTLLSLLRRFRTIIWRKEKVSDPSSEVSNLGEKVSNPSQKVSGPDEKVTKLEGKSNRAPLTAKQQKVLEFCDEMPRTAREILEMIGGVKYHTKTLEQYINKLVYAGRLRPTNAKSHDQNRKYITGDVTDISRRSDGDVTETSRRFKHSLSTVQADSKGVARE